MSLNPQILTFCEEKFLVKQMITSQWDTQNAARDRDGADDDDGTIVVMGNDINLMAVEANFFNHLKISN